MEARRATETTLMMMMMSSGMVMMRREQLVSTNSRHNVKVWLASLLPAMAWYYVLQGGRLDNHPGYYGVEHCITALSIAEHAWTCWSNWRNMPVKQLDGA